MSTTHKQVTVIYHGTPIEVDEGMAELLTLLWGRGVNTSLSCQENRKGIAWIMFPTPEDAAKFLNIVTEYPTKAKNLWETMYGRAIQYGDEGNWEYSLLPVNRGVYEYLSEDDEAVSDYRGFNDFTFDVSIRFPVSDISKIVKRLKHD